MGPSIQHFEHSLADLSMLGSWCHVAKGAPTLTAIVKANPKAKVIAIDYRCRNVGPGEMPRLDTTRFI